MRGGRRIATGRRAGLALAAVLAGGTAATAATSPEEAAARWERASVQASVESLARSEEISGDAIAWVTAWDLATLEAAEPGLERYRAFAEEVGDPGYPVLAEVAEATLRIALFDPEKELRTHAIQAMELSGDPRFIDVLLGVMEHDPVADVREDGAHALRRIGGRATRVALRRALDHPSVQVQQLAADALARMNDNTARRFLRREARGGDRDRQLWAAGMLVRLEDRTALTVLEPLSQDPDASVRIAALGHLAKMEHDSVISIVTPMLDDPEEPVRFAAAAALAELGEDAGIDIIRETARSGQKAYRMRSLALLASLDDRESIPIMKAALQDASSMVREQAATALVEMGDPDGNAYFAEQEEAFGTLGGWAGELLAGSRTSDEEPEAPLDVRAQDVQFENRYSRAATVKRLGRMGPSQIGPIRSVLDDPHPIPRSAALWALAEAGGRVDIPAAIPLLADPDPAVRFDAAGAILKLLAKDRG